MVTYGELVDQWMCYRIAEGYVAKSTAVKAAKNAKRFRGIVDAVASDLKPTDIVAQIAELRGKLSGTTIRKCYVAGSAAFKWAIDMEMLYRNPFAKVKKPKEENVARRSLEESEARRLCDELRDGFADVWCKFAMLALMTGMRRGELLALKWSDIDGCTINCKRAVKQGGEIGTPKSYAGIRSISIDASTRDMLDSIDRVGEYVFFGDCDGHASANEMEHWWSKWRREHGFDGLRFHELRHTHATMLITNGIDIKTVQTRMGHSDPSITLSVYAHAVRKADKAAAATIGRMFS